MTSKKYLLAMALMLGTATGALAQLAGTHNYMDSSYIPARRMAQQNEWRNNSKDQNFPARPRDMWQLGITGGMFIINGDCPPLPGYNFGLSIRKALGYVLSLRGSVVYGQTKGLDYRRNGNLNNNAALAIYGTAPNTGFYVHNYKTTAIIPSLDALFSLNNIMFHSKQSKLNVTVGVGYSPFIYKTAMNLRNGNAAYAFNTLAPTFFQRERKEIRDDLRDFFDDSYETPARVDDRSPNLNNSDADAYQVRHSFSLIGGLEYRLGKKVSLGLDLKYIFTGDDYIDGWVYQGSSAAFTSSKDAAILTNLSLNFNLGNSSKRTAPLWQLNPLDWVYSEINNPVHTKFPPVVLPDADDDGVTDQFDVEPNTPAGSPVDVRGKARDTDSDGVPDFRDKELITPTTCQPVNADGVGTCPPPACCAALDSLIRAGGGRIGACGIGDLPSVRFTGNSRNLSRDAQAILTSVAQKMKDNPSCVITIIGYGEADKRAQQMSWDRANAVRTYLIENQGIGSERLIFKYGESGSSDTVDLQDIGTGDGSPNTVPPRPEYRR